MGIKLAAAIAETAEPVLQSESAALTFDFLSCFFEVLSTLSETENIFYECIRFDNLDTKNAEKCTW